MIVGILSTDNGPHPPEKWAAVTAGRVIDISANPTGVVNGVVQANPQAVLREAEQFRQIVMTLLTHHHAEMQEAERAHLRAKGADRLAEVIDVSAQVESAVRDVLDAARSTSFAEHFTQDQVHDWLRVAFAEDFHHIALIERSWHVGEADDPSGLTVRGDQNHPLCQAFRRAQTGELEQDHPIIKTMLAGAQQGSVTT